MPQTLSSHVDTTSATLKSISLTHSAQHDTITSNRTSRRRKTGNKGHSRSHNNQSQPNNTNLIYAPKSTLQTSTHAPQYTRHSPPARSWVGPPPKRSTPLTNPQTPTTRFSLFISRNQHTTPQLHVYLTPYVCHWCPRTSHCQHFVPGIDSQLVPQCADATISSDILPK